MQTPAQAGLAFPRRRKARRHPEEFASAADASDAYRLGYPTAAAYHEAAGRVRFPPAKATPPVKAAPAPTRAQSPPAGGLGGYLAEQDGAAAAKMAAMQERIAGEMAQDAQARAAAGAQAPQPQPAAPAQVPLVRPSARAQYPDADPVTGAGFPALPPEPRRGAPAAECAALQRTRRETRRQLCSATWRRHIYEMEQPGARSEERWRTSTWAVATMPAVDLLGQHGFPLLAQAFVEIGAQEHLPMLPTVGAHDIATALAKASMVVQAGLPPTVLEDLAAWHRRGGGPGREPTGRLSMASSQACRRVRRFRGPRWRKPPPPTERRKDIPAGG